MDSLFFYCMPIKKNENSLKYLTIKTREREREKRTLTTIKDKHRDPRREYRIRKTRGDG